MAVRANRKAAQKTVNTIKVYGALRVRGIREFVSLCATKGLPMRLLNILSIRRSGYRGRQFDNRNIEIQLSSEPDAELLDRSLRWAEENVLEMRHWRHELTFKPIPTRNKFSLLADLCQHTKSLTDKADICCWNINSTRGKTREIREFLIRSKIDVLGLVETSGNSDCLKDQVPGFAWFGRSKSRRAGGVGFLVNESILTHCRVETHNGKTADTIFLRVTPENSRSTLLMLVYGKASASQEESRKQWSSYETDLRAQLKQCPEDTDTVFFGDINVRMGHAENEEEEHHISLAGESTRNPSGREALAFLQRTDMVCLNNRSKNQKFPQFTYREKGKTGKSVIDVICTSRGLFSGRSEARVLHETLTTRESHFPVAAPIRWHRRRPRPRYSPERNVWNLKRLKVPEVRKKFQAKCDVSLQTLEFKATASENAQALCRLLKRTGEDTIGKIRVGGKPRRSREDRKSARASRELREYRSKHQGKIAGGSEEHLHAERELESKLRTLRRKQKNKRHQRLARKLEAQQSDGDIRGVMRTTREFMEENKSLGSTISSISDVDHRIQTSTHAILAVFEEYWGPRLKNTNSYAEMKCINLEHLAEADHNPLCDAPVNIEELDAALGMLEFHKAQGPDELPPAFFMQPTKQLKNFLLRLFNQALSNADFPAEWKTDRRMPLHKSGKKTDVDKYRLLAINSVCRKLFCSILKRRIEALIELDDAQNGFR